jgi:hypothetical protein
MAMLSFCGIDVSKDRLDVMVLPEQQCSSVRNDAAGWADLIEQLRDCSIAAIDLEASGGYERGVMRALLAGGTAVPDFASLIRATRDTIAHSITSSAAACRVSGTVRPSALAVLRLMTSSNFVGCRTGRSAGLTPLRIFPE